MTVDEMWTRIESHCDFVDNEPRQVQLAFLSGMLARIEQRRTALAEECAGYQGALDILKARAAALEPRPDYMAAVRAAVGR